MKTYLLHIGTIISQSLNVILFNGYPDESISARCYREKRKQKIIIDFLIKLIFKQENHCYKAYLTDVNHAKDILKHFTI